MKKKILLGLSGSVACSKAELFVNQNSDKYELKLISTHSGLNYLTEQFKNSNDIYSDWSELSGSPHIELARWADEIIIYPASANLISKISSGIADDLLTSTILMFSKPIYICPAMHEEMYMNSQIQSNILNLSNNHYIIGPRYGNLDIGDTGLGRLIEPDELLGVLNKQKGKIIVTSGPTYEKIDDVKVVTNKSSGKQGRALAIELSARGYEIIYIHSASIDHIPGLDNVSFHSSNDLKNKIADYSKSYNLDVVIDFVSSKSSLELGCSILGKGGRLVTLGGSGEQFLANSADMLVKELELIGSRYCTKQELKESLDLYARGLIEPLVSVKTDFNGAECLHDKIEKGEITGRAGILI